MRPSRLALAALLLGACGSTEPTVEAPAPEPSVTPAPAVAGAGQRLTISYVNNLDGEIEPCG
jgi:uncharacterized lipoprotein YmbA